MSNLIDLNAVATSLRLPESVDPALAAHIEYIKSQLSSYRGEYHADWLLTEFDDPIWKTRKKSTRRQNGDWKGTEDINWDQLLPDGQRLTDSNYSKLLETCRRASFLYRQGLTGNPPAVATWVKFNGFLLNLCNWMVIESARYHPEKHAFALLDDEGVRRLFLVLGRGGWEQALGLSERCLDAIHRNVFGIACPAELLNSAHWPDSLQNQVIAWLEENARYAFDALTKKYNGLISRVWLSSQINVSVTKLVAASPRVNVVLRQFEPKLQHPRLLLPGVPRREYPSHRTLLLEDAESRSGNESLLANTKMHFTIFFKLFRHLPKDLPDPIGFQLKKAEMEAKRYCKPRGHTPFMPVDIGLAYLNESLRWVCNYGDALVDYYLQIYAKRELRRAPSGAIHHNKSVDKILFASTPLPQALKIAGFEFTRYAAGKSRTIEECRKAPLLHEALEIWVGAVVVLLGLMKPARDIEITSLPRQCLLRTRAGHYWLDSYLAKRTKAEVRARTGGKPIPVIAARAIQQVRKLNRGLVKIHQESDQHLRELLFYLPSANKPRTAVAMRGKGLNYYLDQFCDYVNLPTDDHGRRWYIRIHEMRKWFLLLLFWSGRYDVLDAARWIAGHTDVEHLYAYIEREFPSGKIGELEAECAIDLLAQYDETQINRDGEEVGLGELYRQVLQHFHVKRLNLVKEREWHGLVHELFERDYYLEPITLVTQDDQKHVCIAIRQGSREEGRND